MKLIFLYVLIASLVVFFIIGLVEFIDFIRKMFDNNEQLKINTIEIAGLGSVLQAFRLPFGKECRSHGEFNIELPMWHDFCRWIKSLPYANELIIS